MKNDDNLGHLMVDIETLGTKSYSIILSIGAVEFDISTGITGREFYQTIDINSSIDYNFKIDGDTFYWWLNQDENSRKLICNHTIDIYNALLKFKIFIDELKDIQIWSNGSKYDLGLLDNAYQLCKLKTPWNYRNERDVRTLVSLAPHIKNNIQFLGVRHNPIDDCKYQIKYCSEIWKSLITK